MLAMPVLSSKAVRRLEQEYAAAHGGHCYALMELAGAGLVRQLLRVRAQPRLVWIFVGKGNNGGDGYVAARLLREQGIAHRVFALGSPHPGTEAAEACRRYQEAGGYIETDLPEEQAPHPDVIIDALLGTGITAAPRPPLDEWILCINRTHAFTLAVDVPSGLNADSGAVPGDCVTAQLSVCMLALKPGLFTGEGVDYCGEVVLEDLGLAGGGSSAAVSAARSALNELPTWQRTYEDMLDDLPQRLPSSHKGDAGKVLIVGGAKGFGGAACMAAQAALRAGAGLIKVALDPCNIAALNAACPEIMTVDFSDETAFAQALSWADCVALGPGLGRSAQAQTLTERCLSCARPLVIDADALNIIAVSKLTVPGHDHILTPHPGEAARLLNCSVSAVNADRLGSARALQQRWGGIVLLKGAGSIVCDGRRLDIIREGSPAMASGGMGDVLTGLCAAYVAQGLAPKLALLAAACVHGRAGALAGRDGIIGTKATDLLPFIRRLTNRLPC